MRKQLVLIFCIVSINSSFAQFGVSIHQSNLPFIGFNYEVADRFVPELRLGVDTNLENMSVEAVATYQFINKKDVEVYVGLGGRANNIAGLVVPIGAHFFPFSSKNFGFHIELAPIVYEGSTIVRGSWGIRYRFKENGNR
ncbi:hypothetical protein [Dyadobacter chenhuakuii]|uniref:Outer membrane protein with beta-barrel domain n=1 Tax=Dyadobacter chenhuakuii TaxID=2909339 RepID=A0ABY4XPJ6_9BACT|nr:hypothetical protein [Dyadobacter chenhuakuii]MCF2494412.1 hypothetical protein [Dyadobacter chenhuakuii]USJ32262.1 hypothetical protein NFI80_05860 [Dyadobacter chenhuakuii]